jgi:hypothetical protein
VKPMSRVDGACSATITHLFLGQVRKYQLPSRKIR